MIKFTIVFFCITVVSFTANSSTNEQDKNWLKLFQAARKGQINEVKELLKESKKPIWLGRSTFPHEIINCKNRNQNQLTVIKLLAEAGVDFMKNDLTRDSLMVNSMCHFNEKANNETNLPAQTNTLDIAKYLIASDANSRQISSTFSNINIKGRSALSYAIQNENESLAIYLAKYSDISHEDIKMAMYHGLGKLISNFIANGVDYSQHELIRWSIHDGSELRRRSSHINQNNTYHEQVLIDLLNDGLDPNKFIVDQGYFSHPMIYAVYKNNLSAIKVLRLYGAKIDVTDNKGRSLLDIAKRQNHIEIIQYLDNL